MFRFLNRSIANRLAVVAVVVSLAGCSGGGKPNANFPNVKISNFGQMDHRFYRGAQPRESDFKELANMGIKTVIDLRDDPKSYERPTVESLGMRYVNIPMDDRTYPRNEQVEQFLQIVDDPQTGKFFVHCEGGRHRTGVIGAVYRFRKDGWDYDRAYTEMEEYDFYTWWGHGPMKDFVWDYWQQHR
jgi:protein tyrosine/serine phosphatase